MAKKKIGKQTIAFDNPPTILSSAAIAGVKEGEGPLARYFDQILPEDMFGEKTWEKAESKLQKTALGLAMDKASLSPSCMDYIFAGDLLNQCASSHYGLRDMQIPFLGIFGACSTMAQSMMMAAMAVDGCFGDYALAVTSSHFCSAEKQFRYPLEYGGQRPLTSQWTVTGAGSALITAAGKGPYITHATIGTIIDMGITDANNMGAAMAPAAAETLAAHFNDTGFQPADYDLIVSGDLASIGTALTRELMREKGFELGEHYDDCGNMIFYAKEQDVHAGGSGCGCSAVVFCGYILEKMRQGELNNVLFMGTGALMNPTALLQGESIPCIAHAVAVRNTLQV